MGREKYAHFINKTMFYWSIYSPVYTAYIYIEIQHQKHPSKRKIVYFDFVFLLIVVYRMSSHDFESVQRAVLAEVTKHDHGLKHVDPPAECLSTTQAKMLLEVQGGKHELNHVEHRPKDGLTDAEKQAYLQEKQTK